MASTNLDRTAIVKIALFGSVNLKEGMQDISKQLHDFSYSVIDDGNGSQSYKFKIELVNTDESFLKSIVHAYSSMMGNKSGLITQDDVLQSFPKLLIQWGYNNALSKIHTAQLSNLTYKFTQGKEKIIVIEAVNTGDWAAEFFKKAATTTQTYSLGSSRGVPLYPVANGKITRNVTQVLMDMMTSLLLTVNGVEASHEFDDEEIAAETDIILNHLRNRYSRELRMKVSNSKSGSRTLDSSVEGNSSLSISTLNKFTAVKEFFKNFGIEVLNKVDQLNLKNQRYLPIQEFISKEDTGGYGTITSYLPLSQLKDSSKLGNLEPALEDKAKSEMRVSLDTNSNSDAANVISLYVADYNALVAPTGDPTAMIYESSVKLNAYVAPAAQNSLKEGAQSISLHIASVDSVDGNGRNVGGLGLLRNSRKVKISSTTKLAGESINIKDKLKSLDYQVQQAKEDQNINDTFTTEQKEKYDVKNVNDESDISFTQLPPEERERLKYTNLEFTLTSPQGYSTLDTVKDIIKKFNLMVSNATNRVSMTEESAVAPGDSFITVWEELNEKPKDITTTVFKIKSGKLASKLAREDLPDIKSFPHINYTPSAGVVEMSYGEANSIVKYFDFNGDLRVLTHILGAVALEQTLKNEYEYLNNDIVRTTVLPILQLLLNEEEFFDQLSEDDSIDGKRLKADIQALVNQLSPENTKNSQGTEESVDKVGISSKFFEDTGYITEYISSINFTIRASLNPDGTPGIDGTNINNTLHFLKAIAQAEGTKALFNRVDKTAYQSGNSTIVNYGKVVAGEQLEDVKEVNPTYVYTLIGNNIFDQYYDNLAAQEKRNFLSPNAANIAMDTYFRHGAENWEIKVKTLGIPEMDTLNEISAPRLFKFNVHDLSSEKPLEIGDPFNMHWLSGQYQPLAITHRINKSGYVSEFKLFKNMRLG